MNKVDWVGVAFFVFLSIWVGMCYYQKATVGKEAIKAGLVQDANDHWVKPSN